MSIRHTAPACGLMLVFAMLTTARSASGQTNPKAPGAKMVLTVTVANENDVALPDALVFLHPSSQTPSIRCETDYAGRCQFQDLVPGPYELQVQKENFYMVKLPVQIGTTSKIDVTLTRQQEVREIVNVVESPPAIDPDQTSSKEQLSGLDIINIPYPTTREYRNALNFIPGVVNDVMSQPHIAGAHTYQTLTELDGFNVTQPADGLLAIRVSTDAFRSIDVEPSRYAAEYGKGSGGLLALNTGIGDNQYRFSATNFIPSLQNKKGITLDKITPRFTFSGPIRKQKMWFYDAVDGEYDNIVVTELPNGADHDNVWRIGNLAKVQANLSPRTILTISFLVNHLHDDHLGLGPRNPVEATPSDTESAYVASVKDQYYFPSGALLDAGFAFNRYASSLTPLGTAPYFISPETTGGNFYFLGSTAASRWQALGNLHLAPREWHGRHELKIGVDLDRLAYDAHFQRQPISFLREGQTLPSADACLTLNPSPCSRYAVFPGSPDPATNNVEISSYLQDRWSPTSLLLVEAGVRFDWDDIVHRALFSPRLAATYVLNEEGNTKFSAGIGSYYDATNLVLVTRPSAGTRLDYFFDSSGTLVPPPILTTFSSNPGALQEPRVLNWSLAIEQKLPAAIYLKAEFIQKRGTHGFVYNTLPGTPSGDFVLQNTRQDHFDSIQINAHRNFKQSYQVMVSYTHSSARSNEVLDFNVDNPIFSPQAAGPMSWDAPNRILSWGLLPLLKGFDLGYSLEARTGFPFSVVNDQQQLVGPPNDHRFPAYFSLNLSVEKRFRFHGRNWAIRGGFDNITGHFNPGVVNNNIDSPQFLTFSGSPGRAFVGRIRFLGRR